MIRSRTIARAVKMPPHTKPPMTPVRSRRVTQIVGAPRGLSVAGTGASMIEALTLKGIGRDVAGLHPQAPHPALAFTAHQKYGRAANRIAARLDLDERFGQ